MMIERELFSVEGEGFSSPQLIFRIKNQSRCNYLRVFVRRYVACHASEEANRGPFFGLLYAVILEGERGEKGREEKWRGKTHLRRRCVGSLMSLWVDGVYRWNVLRRRNCDLVQL